MREAIGIAVIMVAAFVLAELFGSSNTMTLYGYDEYGNPFVMKAPLASTSPQTELMNRLRVSRGRTTPTPSPKSWTPQPGVQQRMRTEHQAALGGRKAVAGRLPPLRVKERMRLSAPPQADIRRCVRGRLQRAGLNHVWREPRLCRLEGARVFAILDCATHCPDWSRPVISEQPLGGRVLLKSLSAR